MRGEGGAAALHPGFKPMQITASALTAEALKLTIPASALSRCTESHNQDKVSMGTIAARDLRRTVERTETVAPLGEATSASAQLTPARNIAEAYVAQPMGVRLNAYLLIALLLGLEVAYVVSGMWRSTMLVRGQ